MVLKSPCDDEFRQRVANFRSQPNAFAALLQRWLSCLGMRGEGTAPLFRCAPWIKRVLCPRLQTALGCNSQQADSRFFVTAISPVLSLKRSITAQPATATRSGMAMRLCGVPGPPPGTQVDGPATLSCQIKSPIVRPPHPRRCSGAGLINSAIPEPEEMHCGDDDLKYTASLKKNLSCR